MVRLHWPILSPILSCTDKFDESVSVGVNRKIGVGTDLKVGVGGTQQCPVAPTNRALISQSEARSLWLNEPRL